MQQQDFICWSAKRGLRSRRTPPPHCGVRVHQKIVILKGGYFHLLLNLAAFSPQNVKSAERGALPFELIYPVTKISRARRHLSRPQTQHHHTPSTTSPSCATNGICLMIKGYAYILRLFTSPQALAMPWTAEWKHSPQSTLKLPNGQ